MMQYCNGIRLLTYLNVPPGVWDDVNECKDELSFVHDEMKVLLKEKLMLEEKLDAQVNLLECADYLSTGF